MADEARVSGTDRGGRRGRIAATVAVVGVCLFLLAGMGVLAWLQSGSAAGGPRGGSQPAAIEVAAVEVGRLEGQRAYSATLEARAQVTIAPKVAATIVSLPVDLGDVVERGQVIARLDGDEFVQAAAQSEAELEVARAQHAEALSAAEIAARELERTVNLHARGIASEAQLDQARASELTARSAVAVAQAQVSRSRAALEAARIRLGYTTIRAEWEGGSDTRVIARRWAEEGDTVGANTPLLSVVELDPIRAVFFATQRDYGRLAVGQAVSIGVEAFPGQSWEGAISRIAPVFDQGSRQARVEVVVPNERRLLKPGMFVRATVVLDVAEAAAIVPLAALTRRDGQELVFVLDDDGQRVRAMPVRVLVTSGDRVAVEPQGAALLKDARVVTLGHQLIGDGSPVVVPGAPTARTETASTLEPNDDREPAGGGA